MNQTNKYLKLLLFICFAGTVLFLSFNRHSHSGYSDYHSVIWADKAGYYMYLPGALKYQLDPAAFPDSIDKKTGWGFRFDHEQGKVLTKYTYGVALLQLPFYLAADALAPAFGFEANGFSHIYHWCINVAAVFYLFLGLFFLRSFLRRYYSAPVVLATLASLFLGTNLYYYAVDDTGMSHIYSFALFSALLYLLETSAYFHASSLLKTFLTGCVAGLILVIRPTNAVFLLCCFFLHLGSKEELWLRLRGMIRPQVLVPLAVGAFLALLPQLLYWKYAQGSFLNYSYGSEGFNWTQPKLLATWFSPNNGLFLYTPFYVIIIAAMLHMIKNKEKNGLYLLLCFLLISYIYCCWWDRTFGCSFGARSYVEYFSLFSIAIGYFYERIAGANKLQLTALIACVLIFIIFNLKVTYTFDSCFFGNDSDWKEYFRLVTSPPK